MAQVVVTEEAFDDIERLYEFLAQQNRQWAVEAVAVIRSGLGILGSHPLVGRPVEHALHELIISKGKTGYVALYQYDEARDEAVVLAVRHQREIGFP